MSRKDEEFICTFNNCFTRMVVLNYKTFIYFFFQELYNGSWCQIESRAKVKLPDTAGQETPHYVQTGTGAKAWDARNINTLCLTPTIILFKVWNDIMDHPVCVAGQYNWRGPGFVGQEEKSRRVKGDAARCDKTHTKTSLSCGRGVAVSMSVLCIWPVCVGKQCCYFLAYPMFTLTLFTRSHSTQHQTSLCGCLATTNVSHTLGFKQETYCTLAPRRPEESTAGR